MTLLFTVCGRAGSKGLKSKNLLSFLGQPLMYHTLAAVDLFTAAHLDTDFICAVNTDSDALLEQARGTRIPVLAAHRSEELSGDRASKVLVIADTLRQAEAQTGLTFDAVIDMDLTSPLRRLKDVEGVLDTLLAHPDADAVLSVTAPRRNPYFNQLAARENGYLGPAIPSDFVARQQAPAVWDANASLYAYRPSYLKNTDGVLLHAKLLPWVMRDTAVLDIDSGEDFELMGLLGAWFYENDPEMGAVRAHIPAILK